MLEGRLAGIPFAGVDTNQVGYEIFGRLGNVVPIRTVKLVFALHDLRKQVVVVSVLIVEGWITAQKNVGDHADRPNVHRLAVPGRGGFSNRLVDKQEKEQQQQQQEAAVRRLGGDFVVRKSDMITCEGC